MFWRLRLRISISTIAYNGRRSMIKNMDILYDACIGTMKERNESKSSLNSGLLLRLLREMHTLHKARQSQTLFAILAS